jgi:hypothetical protein
LLTRHGQCVPWRAAPPDGAAAHVATGATAERTGWAARSHAQWPPHDSAAAALVCAVEVAAAAGNLNSGDCFVLLEEGGASCVWAGKYSSEPERQVAAEVAGVLGGEATIVAEGQEADSFWEALGGGRTAAAGGVSQWDAVLAIAHTQRSAPEPRWHQPHAGSHPVHPLEHARTLPHTSPPSTQHSCTH